MRRRTITRDGTAPDGTRAVGRGYEFVDDDGTPLSDKRLMAGAGGDLAVLEVRPGSLDDRRALTDPSFGIDRDVVLASEDETIVVRSADGRLRAGHLAADQSAAVARLLDERPGLVAWVCWEWLREDGRAGLRIALSDPGLRPERLVRTGVPEAAPTTSWAKNPYIWLAVAVFAAIAILVAIQI